MIGEKLTVHCIMIMQRTCSGTFKGPMKVFKIKRSFIPFMAYIKDETTKGLYEFMTTIFIQCGYLAYCTIWVVTKQ